MNSQFQDKFAYEDTQLRKRQLNYLDARPSSWLLDNLVDDVFEDEEATLCNQSTHRVDIPSAVRRSSWDFTQSNFKDLSKINNNLTKLMFIIITVLLLLRFII